MKWLITASASVFLCAVTFALLGAVVRNMATVVNFVPPTLVLLGILLVCFFVVAIYRSVAFLRDISHGIQEIAERLRTRGPED
jgi:hypothetical protein